MLVRAVWGRLGIILRREGADTKVTSSFYRAVVQVILLYGSEIWFLFGNNGKEDIGDAHGVLGNDHIKKTKSIRRWDIEDSGGRMHMRGSRNPVGSDLHRATAGNRGAVGGAMSLI